MSDSQITDSRPVCQLFAARKCRKGRFCRFLHVVTIDRDGPLQQNENAANFTPETDEFVTAENSQREGHQRPICKHFFRKGWCGFGRRCAFSHSDTRPRDVTVQCANDGENNRDIIAESLAEPEAICVEKIEKKESVQMTPKDIQMKDSDESRSAVPSQKAVKVCRFFKAGYCRMGRRCHFQHLLPQYRDHFDGRPGRVSDAVFSSREDLKSIHSETSSDSGVVDDIAPRIRRDVVIEAISEAEEGKHPVIKERTAAEELREMRSIEIRQFKKRFPNAKETLLSNNCSQFQFIFTPTDPDWPYDVKEMNLQVEFPAEYPSKTMTIVMLEEERVPETVRRLMTEGISEWIASRFEALKTSRKNDLAFRPFLRWFDRKSEDMLTEALKAYRRERMAEIAGVQFISADQLKTRYRYSDQEDVEAHLPANNDGENERNQQETNFGETAEDVLTGEETEDLHRGNKPADVDQSGRSSGIAARRGTEVTLQNLQLLNGAATLLPTSISLMISCSRCSNKSEVKTAANQLSKVDCPYCHNQQLIMFRPSVAHQFSSVIGYLDLDQCDAFDMILTDCLFIINCLECSKDNKLQALPPGQLNTTWCFHCHNKLTVAANNVRFLKLETATTIDMKNACTVEVKRQVKKVKDPAIVEGKPLPDNGTCKHFRKSFRWFRFPCCGKAYPCDHCHDEKEKDHEMLLANRIICGFCAKEQPYSSDRPCSGCYANITNKATAHWEGGTGCRDKVKMSRGDSKKYTDSLKTVSCSSQNKKNPGKKVTKLRHI